MSEVEILIPAEQPVRAWRVFSVGLDGEQVRLFSTSAALSNRSWQAEERAVCGAHPSPGANCRCGLYGVTADLGEPLMGAYLPVWHAHALVYAEVALSGRAFVDFRAVRAERARVLQIVAPEKLLVPGFELGEPEQELSDYYGAVIGGVEALPEWVLTRRWIGDVDAPLPEWAKQLAVSDSSSLSL